MVELVVALATTMIVFGIILGVVAIDIIRNYKDKDRG